MALERLAVTALREHDLRSTVTADVHERVQRAVAVTDDHERDAAGAVRDEVAGPRDGGRGTGVLPLPAEDPLLLGGEDAIVDVPRAGERGRSLRLGRALHERSMSEPMRLDAPRARIQLRRCLRRR
jgi:hypothetical protein